jgi:hypothetical protein
VPEPIRHNTAPHPKRPGAVLPTGYRDPDHRQFEGDRRPRDIRFPD